MKKKLENNGGITLIALVVTIVVLLILAGVSISMLAGENGIITQAQKSKEETEIGKEKEYINASISTIRMQKLEKGQENIITSMELEEELNKYESGVKVTGNLTLIVTYQSGRSYNVTQNGKIEIENEEDVKIVMARAFNDEGLLIIDSKGRIYKQYREELLNIESFEISTNEEEMLIFPEKIVDWQSGHFISESGKIYVNKESEIICLNEDEAKVPNANQIKKYSYNASSDSYMFLTNDGKLYKLNNCISELENDLNGKYITDFVENDSITIAIDKDGKLYAWGSNWCGQLGNGTTTYNSNPQCISELENELKNKRIVSFWAGRATVLALDEDGDVYTWGYNYNGQLGNGTTENSSVPICISDIEGNALKGKNIVDIYTDGYTVIARDNNGEIYTWGSNSAGQLGNGTTEDSCVPIYISDIETSEIKDKNIVGIYTENGTVIAKDTEGKIYAWGNNYCGLLGIGNSTIENSTIPICISSLKDKKIIQIVVTEVPFVVALDSEGNVYTWGCNYSGFLGDGTTEDSNVPVLLNGVEGNTIKNEKVTEIVQVDGGFTTIKTEKGDYYYFGCTYMN